MSIGFAQMEVFATNNINVYVSFEGMSLGHGFYIEPTRVTVPAGSTGDVATMQLLRDRGHTFNSVAPWGFQLDDISGFNRGYFNPASFLTIDLTDHTEENGLLSWFMYSAESGWMVTVNHAMLDIGIDGHVLQDGDVLRWGFSVQGWGADLGVPTWDDGQLFEQVDKTELIRATVNAGLNQNALDVIINPLATVAQVQGAMPAVAPPAHTSLWEEIMNQSLDYLRREINPSPIVGSVGGEWAVLALARAGRVEATDPWLQSYLSELRGLVGQVESLSNTHNIQNPPSVGTFPSDLRRWTDFQRVTLAVTALGFDAQNFHSFDLTEIYKNFVPADQRHALNMTINADIFALIALNSGNYSGETEAFIRSILESQRADGTWSLNPSAPTNISDIDITAMAIQALAPYYGAGRADLDNAVARGLSWLNAQSFPDVEGLSQMVVALTELGYVQEATAYVEQMLGWFDPENGGFRRPNASVNIMATEQAAYALIAYWRANNNMSPLYSMSNFTTATATATGFTDVENHISKHAIEYLAQRGIINGRSANIFAPNDTMTRAEFAAIITRALDLQSRGATMFVDVPSDAWFAVPVATAFYYEIVGGISATEFNPNGTITNQEAIVMVARAARLLGFDTTVTNTNIEAAPWAVDSIAFALREGLIDQFEGISIITRGEIAEIVYRLLKG